MLENMEVEHNNNQEIETKFLFLGNTSVSAIRSKLEDLGFGLVRLEKQVDAYWDTEDCKIINLKRGLRLRYNEGKLCRAEFKSLFSSGKSKYIEEIDLMPKGKISMPLLYEILCVRLSIVKEERFVGLDEVPDMPKLLKGLGLRPVLKIQKSRHVFTDSTGECEVCVDRIPGYPTYLEIETNSDTNTLHRFSCLITKNFQVKKTTLSYIDIVCDSDKRILSANEFSSRFVKNPGWNVQPAEKKYVEKLFA